MPKLSLNGETIDVADEKAAVYAAQGWSTVEDESAAVGDDGAAENVVKRPTKKAATKKAAKKS